MKKYLKKWGVIQLIALSGIFLIEACCTVQTILFGDSIVTVYEGDGYIDIPQGDTISGPFRIEVLYSSYRLQALLPSPVTSAMATTCDHTPNNPIIPESFRLTMDAPMYSATDTLASGTDLRQLDSLIVDSWIEHSNMVFHFNQGLLDEYTIPAGEQHFYIKGQTTNDVQLVDTVTVCIDL